MLSENLFTVEEAAMILKQDAGTVYRWLATGKLKGNRRGKRGSWEIPASELKYWTDEKLSGSEKTILDLVQQIGIMQRNVESAQPRTYGEALEEMMLFLAMQFDVMRMANASQHVRGRFLGEQNRMEFGEATTLDQLIELIQLRREGKLGDEELSEILVERDWVEVYEHLTNELVLVHDERSDVLL
ncbi:excisionase family DNA binding protein [Paenibacillus phyllosphaerae]|uniref:Excisionase family DNA binding protein n=1 Tax=Paenibacillus phyllosphaerae TaxID=274593 RepID=A0A7W5AZT1_9BACL|nr:helix-turn-helix domain-containing protein [Paenibacillus phyllosphaerae]MBB3111066.1 excisionase family DNA binding protein [Paenibacillus phyllosphaerae]